MMIKRAPTSRAVKKSGRYEAVEKLRGEMGRVNTVQSDILLQGEEGFACRCNAVLRSLFDARSPVKRDS